jgi:predicted amidophosphoribosyltransferase
MPLHPLRLRERGFNQALELARPVGKACRMPYRHAQLPPHPSHRHAGRPTLARKSKERSRSLHCESDFTGKRLLLIDDVMTTGASLDELARTVKLHGAVRVVLLVVARTLPA